MTSQETERFEQALEESADSVPSLECAKPPEDSSQSTFEALGVYSLTLASFTEKDKLESQ